MKRVDAVYEEKHGDLLNIITHIIYIAFRTSAQRIVKRPDIIYIVPCNKNRLGAQRILLYWWYILIQYPENSERFLAF